VLYKPAMVRLAAWREPGGKLLVRNRAPAAMLAAGFLANPLLLRTEEVRRFYEGGAVLRPGAYSVELLAQDERFWQATLRFRIYRVENPLGARAVAR
jgi:hypothetical protein